MKRPKPTRQLFATRRLVLPPTPAPDLLMPLLTTFLAVILGTIIHLLLPAQPPATTNADYQITTYTYLPPEDQLFSVVARTNVFTAGHATQKSTAWTIDRTTKKPYSLTQIFRDPAVLDDLTQTPATKQDLKSSFAIDRANQTLVLSVGGAEHKIKFADLEGKLSYKYSEPMFGLNPFTYKDPDHIDCKVSRCLALTFDDGPSAHTDRLLDILKYRHAKATFFVLGHRAKAFSGQLARTAREGHDIGTHSWNHRYYPNLSRSAMLNDLKRTTNALQPITGQRIKFFRPPYGSTNRTVYKVSAQLKQRVILWDIDPQDWRNKNAKAICKHVVAHATKGSIILLHDIYSTTVDATKCIIDKLSDKYTFVNLSTLLK